MTSSDKERMTLSQTSAPAFPFNWKKSLCRFFTLTFNKKREFLSSPESPSLSSIPLLKSPRVVISIHHQNNQTKEEVPGEKEKQVPHHRESEAKNTSSHISQGFENQLVSDCLLHSPSDDEDDIRFSQLPSLVSLFPTQLPWSLCWTCKINTAN